MMQLYRLLMEPENQLQQSNQIRYFKCQDVTHLGAFLFAFGSNAVKMS